MTAYDRERALQTRLNAFLSAKLGLPPNDYYSRLDGESLAGLKALLADINNIFTFKVSLAFGAWLGKTLALDSTALSQIEGSIRNSAPNANGFDVSIEHPIRVIAEVKCNVPINGGSVYGSAQRNAILDDVRSLMEGKSKSPIDPRNSLKFLVLLDTPQVRAATRHLVKNMKQYRDDIVFVEPGVRPDRTDKLHIIYVVT